MSADDSHRGAGEAWLQGLAMLAILVVFCWYGLHSQENLVQPATLEAPASEFSAARAEQHLRVVAQEPHPIGTFANAEVRDYLVAQLEAQGLEAEVQRATILQPRGTQARLVGAVVENVLARLPGSSEAASSQPAVLLVSHYDSVPWSPGASDDGSGVVALLETLRALRAGPPLGHDVLFLFTDGEEAGLFGAKAFVEQHPWAQRVGVVLNLDARGSSGPSIMFRTSDASGWLVRAMKEAVPAPLAMSLTSEVFRYLPNNTDLAVFLKAGIPGMDFAFIGDHAQYHSSRDSVANLDLTSLQHQGSYILNLTRHLAGPPPEESSWSRGEANLEEALYFNLLGGWLVVYPAPWAIPLAIGAGLLLAAVLVVGKKRGKVRVMAVFGSGLAALLIASATFAVGYFVWQQLAVMDSDFQWMGGRSYEEGAYSLGFSALFAAVAGGLVILLVRQVGGLNATLGAAWVWWLLAMMTALYARGASYLFLWPLVAMVLALGAGLVLGEGRSRWWRLVLLGGGAVPTLLILPPILLLLFQGLGLSMAGILGVFFALGLSLLAGPLELIAKRVPAALPATAFVIAMVLLVPVVRKESFSVENPRPTSLFYVSNPSQEWALWASEDRVFDGWVESHLGTETESSELNGVLPWSPRGGFRTAPAPIAPLLPPEVEVVERSADTESGLYFIRVRIRSQRDAASLGLVVDSLAHIQAVSILGKRWDYGDDPFQGQPGYLLSFYGSTQEPLEVTLELTDRQPVELTVTDLTFGLPEVASPRPPDTMPKAHRWWSDGSFVSTTAFF